MTVFTIALTGFSAFIATLSLIGAYIARNTGLSMLPYMALTTSMVACVAGFILVIPSLVIAAMLLLLGAVAYLALESVAGGLIGSRR